MKISLKCQNEACSAHIEVTDSEWDGMSSQKLLEVRKCPLCGKLRKVVGTDSVNEGSKLESIGTSAIDSMTPMERKALLKRRSNLDFHRNIEERKREMDKNVIPR